MFKRLLLIACMFAFIGESYATVSSKDVRAKIARRIWLNECGGKLYNLVAWNVGEEFPSLGIGHFIWFPRGVKPSFGQSFPDFIAFVESRGAKVPDYFKGHAPWRNRSAFMKQDIKGGLPEKMRIWLARHAELQADYIIARSRASLARIQQASKYPEEIKRKFYAIASTPHGMYALIDYVNFKGEGLKPVSQYKGYSWGLLKVLESMPSVSKGHGAVVAFSETAQKVLAKRIQLAPKSRGENRWKEGWMKRCETYKVPL